MIDKCVNNSSDDAFENKRKNSCRLNFRKFHRKKEKTKSCYACYNDINMKTSLIKSEVTDDETHNELTDKEIKATCKRLKFCKQNNKTDIYKTYDKNTEKYSLERDETICSLAELEEKLHEQTISNSLFTHTKKKFHTYRSCFRRNRNRNKKKSWFRFRRNKKELESAEDLKFLNDSVCSNYKEKYLKHVDNNSHYNPTYVTRTINEMKDIIPWIF